MRIVRRRGPSWKEAATRAAAAKKNKLPEEINLGLDPDDKWMSLISQMKKPVNKKDSTSPFDVSAISPYSIYRKTPVKTKTSLTAAEEDQLYEARANRLLFILACLACFMIGLVTYIISTSKYFNPTNLQEDDNEHSQTTKNPG